MDGGVPPNPPFRPYEGRGGARFRLTARKSVPTRFERVRFEVNNNPEEESSEEDPSEEDPSEEEPMDTDPSKGGPSEDNQPNGGNPGPSQSQAEPLTLFQMMDLDIWDPIEDSYWEAYLKNRTSRGHYRAFLEEVKELYYDCTTVGQEYPAEVWAQITLHHFPYTRAWKRQKHKIQTGNLMHNFDALLEHLEDEVEYTL